ncbi:hypothetical protein PspLS_11845, partial [Pyricularia sp. CBS 133598]
APVAFITSPTSSTGKSTSSSQDKQCSTLSTDPSSLEDFCITKNPDNSLRHALLLDLGFPGTLQPNPSYVPNFKGISTELINPALTELPVAILKCNSSGDVSPPKKNSANLTGPASQNMLINIKQSPNLLKSKPVALDAENNIWEAKKLLAKWGLKKKPYYLGRPKGEKLWEKAKTLSSARVR